MSTLDNRITMAQAVRDATQADGRVRQMPNGHHLVQVPARLLLDIESHLIACAAGAGAPRCVYPDCVNSRRTRGLCHQHYQQMRSYVRDGKADEADLIARGLLLLKGTGGSPVKDHTAFLKGSDVRGRG